MAAASQRVGQVHILAQANAPSSSSVAFRRASVHQVERLRD